MTFKQWASFIGLAIIWGASFLWIKLAVQNTGPFTIASLRLVAALAVLVPFVIVQKPGWPRTRRMWGILMVQGMISTAAPWILITWAEKYIDSALATVMNATVPMFTILAAHYFLHDDRMTRRRMGGLLVGFVGVVVLMQSDLRQIGSGDDVKWKLLGQAAMLAGAFFYGISNVYARAKLRDVSPLYQTFFTMVTASSVMWLVTPVVEAPFTLPDEPVTWIAILWLGMLGAGLSYLVFYHLLHQIGPTRVATVTYVIPVVGVTLGVVFLDEALTGALIAGMVLIVSGVALVLRD